MAYMTGIFWPSRLNLWAIQLRDFPASQNRLIKQSCWRGLPWYGEGEGEITAVFEGSSTDWHPYPALEGSLDLKKGAFLASCSLGSDHLPLSHSQSTEALMGPCPAADVKGRRAPSPSSNHGRSVSKAPPSP